MNYWKTVKSIWEKVEAKNPQGTLSAQLTKSPTTNFTVATNYGVSWDERKGTNLCLVSPNQQTAYSNKGGTHIKFLNFNTETERKNAWQSYLTKFARFCICMDESTKLAPYMGNYTQPWDDQRFYEYFGLNKIEIQLIETVIK